MYMKSHSEGLWVYQTPVKFSGLRGIKKNAYYFQESRVGLPMCTQNAYILCVLYTRVP